MHVEPTMADFYRWRGAVEVEHRHVSYNVAKYFRMDYFAQAVSGMLLNVVLFSQVLRGTKFLVREDPARPSLGYTRLVLKMRASVARGSLPGVGYLLRSASRMLRRDCNPVVEGGTARLSLISPRPRPHAPMADGLRRQLAGFLKPFSVTTVAAPFRLESPRPVHPLGGYRGTPLPVGGHASRRRQGVARGSEAPNRPAVPLADRRIVARDADLVALTLLDPDGARLPRWHPGVAHRSSPPVRANETVLALRGSGTGVRVPNCGAAPRRWRRLFHSRSTGF